MKENVRKGGRLCVVTEGQMASAQRRTEAACARFTAGNIYFTEMGLSGRGPLPTHTPRAALGAAPGGVVLHNLTPGCTPAHKSFVLLMANTRKERKAENKWLSPPSPLFP